MTKSLEEHRNRLLFEVEQLKRKIKLLSWLEHKELVTIRSVSNTDYVDQYRRKK
jgi:hypothetical protein